MWSGGFLGLNTPTCVLLFSFWYGVKTQGITFLVYKWGDWFLEKSLCPRWINGRETTRTQVLSSFALGFVSWALSLLLLKSYRDSLLWALVYSFPTGFEYFVFHICRDSITLFIGTVFHQVFKWHIAPFALCDFVEGAKDLVFDNQGLSFNYTSFSGKWR